MGQVWHLACRLGGQLRLGTRCVIGWDMTAALALAQAMGINTFLVADLLPEVEAVMVRRINERIGTSDGH